MKRILNFIMLLTIIAGSASAQSLSVQPIEAKKGGQAELSVSLTGGTAMTALQFNLQLPAGLTATTDNVTLGAATDGHSLSVETLDSGDLLFVLYSMDLNTFMDGELLRIPVTVSEGAASGEGQLYTVRLATADAVSVSANDVTITSSIAKPGDVNGDGDIDIADAVCVVNYIVGNPTPSFVELAADANGDDDIDIADAVTIVNYIVGNPSSLSPETTYYWYVGTTKPTSLDQCEVVSEYPTEQTYTNNSGAKSHIFVLTNSDKNVTFINPELNAPVDQVAVDVTTISGYKIFETAVGTANTKSIKIKIS